MPLEHIRSAAEVLDTQSAVQGVAMSTKYLHSGAQRWQAELSITRFDISSGTARLANALAAAELVYLLRQGIKLVSRIRRVVADSAEEIASSPHSHAHEQMPRVKQDAMAPLARAVRDARTMPGLQRLARLSVVAEEQKFLRGVEGALWDQAQELMHAGLDSGVTVSVLREISSTRMGNHKHA